MKPGLFQPWKEALVKLTLGLLWVTCIGLLLLAIFGKLGV